MNSRLLGSVLVLAFVAGCLQTAGGADNSLEAARLEYVQHFFAVDAHVNLAKQQHDHGDRLQAFYTLEAARRGHFDEQEFTEAFRRIFLGDAFDNSPQAEAALHLKLKASPNNYETLNKLADVYISREDWAKAIQLLESASKLRPEDFKPVGGLAQVYERMGKHEQSNSVVSVWTKDHPESLEAYHVRIEELLQDEKALGPRSVVEEALKKYPNDAVLHFDLGVVLERAGDLTGEQRELEKAVQLGPNLEQIQGWAARFYLKRNIDLRRALDFYLNAYFLDPDLYDTEYAEERIQKLAPQVAESLMGEAGAKDVPGMLPAVEKVILRSSETNWTAKQAAIVLNIMGSEDEENRASAMKLLEEHADSSLDVQISPLLEDPDARKRGMAGYLAVKWRKEKAFPVLQKWLHDPAELVRFDAISALMEGGAAGRKIVEKYARSGKEPNFQIRALMSSALKEGDDKRH